jgi:uncharacterized protein YndB with AHSA1/START domain
MSSTLEHSQVHATFVVERTYPCPVTDVWQALSDNDARDQWFGAGDAFLTTEKTHDFRVGGKGYEDGKWHGGPRSVLSSIYTDIVEHERIVFTYDMWVDGQHLSTSLTTIALRADGDTTHLTYTEQGVHFDGLDSVEGREQGTRGILEQLGSYLARAS